MSSSNEVYVRLTPFNKPTGALAMRCSVDGKLFVSGTWYTVPEEAGEKLSKIRQKTGAPMFEVCQYAEFRETARKDLAAMAAAAGVQGLAVAHPSIPEPRKHSTKREKKSDFAGIGEAVKEVDLSEGVMTTAQLRQPKNEVEVEEPTTEESAESFPEEEEAPDVSKMKRPELQAFCKKNDVDIPFGASNDELRQLLKDQGLA